MAERWKTHLKKVLEERGLDYKNTSIKAGLNPSMLSEILGKKDKDVPFVPTRFADLEQRAYRVIGNSMNERDIHDGSFVITVEYWKVRTQAQDGDIVVVERHRDGGLVERTIKEIVILPDRIELTPRSTDERFREPFTIPRNITPHDPADPLQIEIVALVIGSYMPIGR